MKVLSWQSILAGILIRASVADAAHLQNGSIALSEESSKLIVAGLTAENGSLKPVLQGLLNVSIKLEDLNQGQIDALNEELRQLSDQTLLAGRDII
jgi:hypothetical protein